MAHARSAATPRHHEVLFYDEVNDLALAVADYVVAGLSDDEPVIVIATAAHVAAIEAVLASSGHDPSLARSTGSCLVLDAAETVASFLVDGVLAADGVRVVMGGILDAAAPGGGTVRVFGEMVALLWEQGDVPGAMALESAWNDLARDRHFSLMCAYPTTALDAVGLGEINQVCHLHSTVVPPPGYERALPGGHDADAASTSKVFVAVPEAVHAARQFVREALASWGEDELRWDGSLIISELATNAIVHGGSAFRTSIERADGVVRIAVEDVGPGLPRSQHALQQALGGRGVAIVEELSDRWGCDRLAAGKVFWVELEASTRADPISGAASRPRW